MRLERLGEEGGRGTRADLISIWADKAGARLALVTGKKAVKPHPSFQGRLAVVIVLVVVFRREMQTDAPFIAAVGAQDVLQRGVFIGIQERKGR